MFTPHGKAPARRGGRSTENQVLSGNGKQVIEQGNQGQADDGDTSAGHELYHGELVVKGFPKIKKQGLSHLYEVELYSFNRI